MESTEERHQLEEIKAQLRRAEKVPNRTAAVRRDALKRLIDLTHSPYTSLKSFAAINFKLFIKDFPDLEDDALNAVYDLCEDPISKVRIDGYYAIIQVSKEQKKWVKRNADVLVQLLQSDEPDEVQVIKKALTEHLDMDPVVTLSVLCDQINPPMEVDTEEGGDNDEEDKLIRERLKSLVLNFLSGEAKRAIIERHANVEGSQAEEMLVTGLLQAIPKSSPGDLQIIIKDLLLSLPSFNSSNPQRRYTSRGNQLLDVLLDSAKTALRSDVSSFSILSKTRQYLDLAQFISTEKKIASPNPLLRFYCSNLISKLTLSRLDEGSQEYVLVGLAEALEACGKNEEGERREVEALKKQVVDGCSVLLSCITEMKDEKRIPWGAVSSFIKACHQRKLQFNWSLPSHLSTAMQKVQSMAASDKLQEDVDAKQVHNLIRSLVPPPAPPTSIASTTTDDRKGMITSTSASTNSSTKPNGSSLSASSQPVILKRPNASLPRKPLPSPNAGTGQQQGQGQAGMNPNRSAGIPPKPESRQVQLPQRTSTPVSGLSSKNNGNENPNGKTTPTTTRIASTTNANVKALPSLLSRLGNISTDSSSGRASPVNTPPVVFPPASSAKLVTPAISTSLPQKRPLPPTSSSSSPAAPKPKRQRDSPVVASPRLPQKPLPVRDGGGGGGGGSGSGGTEGGGGLSIRGAFAAAQAQDSPAVGKAGGTGSGSGKGERGSSGSLLSRMKASGGQGQGGDEDGRKGRKRHSNRG